VTRIKDAMEEQKRRFIVFRALAIVLGAVSMWAGWTAISQGHLWISGHNPKVGRVTTGPILWWVVFGGLLVVAGLFPWKWFANRRK